MNRAGCVAAIALSAVALTTPVLHRQARVRQRNCGQNAARVRGDAANRVKEPGELNAVQIDRVEQNITDLLGLGATSPQMAARMAAPVRIPVYFHSIYAGNQGKVSAAEMDRQIATMNAAYGGRLGGAATGFSFVLKGRDWTDNRTWYQNPQDSDKRFMPKLHRGGPGTLNLYSVDMGDSLLGYSSFPWGVKKHPKLDGVVIHVGTMPGGSIADYNLGYSAVHETGHWLGLYHPFEGWDATTGASGCNGPGDRVADTPAEGSPSQGCPAGKDTCPIPGVDPIHNFMDYSYDSCMNQFTRGQSQRMHKLWAAYR